MIEPLSAEYFLSDLLQSEEVVTAFRSALGVSSEDVLRKAASGDPEEFLDWFEAWRRSLKNQKIITIEAATPEEEIYRIHIGQVGPIYWVTEESEDDDGQDVCYYRTFEEAEREAREHNIISIHRMEQIRQQKAILGRHLLRSLLQEIDHGSALEEEPHTKPNAWCDRKLTVDEAEQLNTKPGKFPFGGLSGQWESLKSQIRDGDEIWSYCSPEATWKAMCGRQGFWLIRDGKVVCDIVTLMN